MIKQMFSGRIGIKQYWLSVLLILLTSGVIVLTGMLVMLGVFAAFSAFSANIGLAIAGIVILSLVGFAASLLIVVPSWGLAVRRYHDVGLSIWVFVGLTIAGMIISTVFPVTTGEGEAVEFNFVNMLINLPLSIVSLAILLWPGTKGENKFGAQTRYESLWKAIKGVQPAPAEPPAL